jgi:hypothetical protein
MTDHPREDHPARRAYDDRTRDITLPPLADRPPSALPRQWAGLAPQPAPSQDTPAPDSSASPPDTQVADVPRSPATDAGVARNPFADQPTGALRTRGDGPRDPTLAFSERAMRHRPVGPVQVDRAPRRWPWVVLVLLPILIIAGAGIALLLILRG